MRCVARRFVLGYRCNGRLKSRSDGMNPIRVVLADDHTLFRAGIRSLLNELDGVEVVGEASDGSAALQLIAEQHPDIALLDIGMAGINGLEVAAQLSAAAAPVRTIILS